ncbi:MAG TPA: hypothetical protein VN030_08335 [Cellvibrio sp.]|nr:hypothetical protein [Cellvibrio sp.]
MLSSEELTDEELSTELVSDELELIVAAADDEEAAAATDAPEPPPQPAKPIAPKAPIPSLSALRRSALTSPDTFSDLLLVVMIKSYESIDVWISGCANDICLLFLQCWKPEGRIHFATSRHQI